MVKDVKLNKLTEDPEPQAYLPYPQARSLDMRIVVRASGDPTDITSQIRDAVWSVDRNQPVSEIGWMRTLITDRHAASIVLTQVTASFGLLALFLAAIGI